MRTVKYRGLSIMGEWFYGYPCIPEYGKCAGHSFILGKTGNLAYEIRPETLGQWTGLLDRNSVEIYEGDIVKESGLVCDDIISEVKWGTIDYESGWNDTPEMTGWLLHTEKYDDMPLFLYSCSEVIGNIYENKELLEEK